MLQSLNLMSVLLSAPIKTQELLYEKDYFSNFCLKSTVRSLYILGSDI